MPWHLCTIHRSMGMALNTNSAKPKSLPSKLARPLHGLSQAHSKFQRQRQHSVATSIAVASLGDETVVATAHSAAKPMTPKSQYQTPPPQTHCCDVGRRPNIKEGGSMQASTYALSGTGAVQVCAGPSSSSTDTQPTFSFNAPSKRLLQYCDLGIIPRNAVIPPQPPAPKRIRATGTASGRGVKRKRHESFSEQAAIQQKSYKYLGSSRTGDGLSPGANISNAPFQSPRPPD